MAGQNDATGLIAALQDSDGTLSEAGVALLTRDSKILEAISKHYTDLFIYQARQRLDAIRFYFLGMALLVTAVTSLASSNFLVAATLLSTCTGLVTVIFLRLDYRNAQIVEIDEKPLKGIQALYKILYNTGDSWETFERCDQTREPRTSYGFLTVWLYSIFWLLSFSAASYFLYEILAGRGYQDCALFVSILVGIVLFLFGLFGTLGRPVVTEQYHHSNPPS